MNSNRPTFYPQSLGVLLRLGLVVMGSWGVGHAGLPLGWAIALWGGLVALGIELTIRAERRWLQKSSCDQSQTDAIVASLDAIAVGKFDVPLQLDDRTPPAYQAIAIAVNRLSQKLDAVMGQRIDQAIATCQKRDITTQAILHAIPDSMFRVNRHGVYLDDMQTGGISCLFSVPHAAGKRLTELLPPDVAENQLHCLQQVLATQQMQTYEQAIAIDGRVRYCEVRAVPCGDDVVLFMIRDVTQQRCIEQETQAQRVFLRQLLDGLPSLISVKDDTGQFLQINRAAAVLYGSTPSELVGLREVDLVDIDPDHYAQWLANDAEVMRSRQPKQISDELIVGVDGERRWYQTMLSPFMDVQGEVQGVICHSVDISDRKQMELELQQAKEWAEAANKAKSAFLSNMSHELRTPLNAILGFAQILQYDDQLSDEHRDYVNTIIESGEHLLALINNILQVTKTETGDLPLVRQPIDLLTMLRSLHAAFQFQAEHKGLALQMELSSELPAMIYGDGPKLRQILTNLIDNALKFTTAGHITVSAQLERSPHVHSDDVLLSRQRPYLQICIADTGIGVPSDQLGNIFEMFIQLPQQGMMPEGAGVGLPLSRHLAQLAGGTLMVESTVGQGSQFYLSIPIDLEREAFGAEHSTPPAFREGLC
jgi:PAS domain S-box-containing protein